MLEFDKTTALISPAKFLRNTGKFPKTVIAVWQHGFVKEAEKYSLKQIASFTSGPVFPIYSLKAQNKEFAFCNIPSGGPSVACFIEECTARGAENFVFSGSCGIIDSSCKHKIIIPTKALKDDGTSFHYSENAEEFAKVKTYDFTENVLKDTDHISAPVWTTDCPYRETEKSIKTALKKGCVAVDMECASIMAVSEFLNVNSYEFLYSADIFENNEWNFSGLFSTAQNQYEQLFNIILQLAGRIA